MGEENSNWNSEITQKFCEWEKGMETDDDVFLLFGYSDDNGFWKRKKKEKKTEMFDKYLKHRAYRW